LIVTRYDKTRRCKVYDVRLRNEHERMQYFAVGHTSKTIVREYEAKLKNKIKEWKMFPERKIKKATFSEFVNKKYLPDHARGMRSERDYMSICKKLVREFGDIYMEAFERYDAETYLNRRYNEVSAYMANREFNVLKGIFTKAESWGYRTKGTNPCKAESRGERVKLKKEEPRWRVLTMPEINRLLGQCRKGSGEFCVDEFHGYLTIEKLCHVLTSDIFGPASHSEHSIEWLNAMLTAADLYDQLIKTKNHRPLSKRIKDIKRKYDAGKDEADLKRLNRILIEEFYPDKTPKMPKKATGLSEKEAIELKDQIEVSLRSGARKSEMLNVKVSDINFDTGMLKLFGKGGKTRFVPIDSRLKKLLERRVTDRKKYIFGNDKDAPKDFKRAFSSACERAGIEDVRPHDLRRTFGTRCAMAGVPPKTLQKWMGHESIETTMKYYVQIPEEFEKEAIERANNSEKMTDRVTVGSETGKMHNA
jgi:integrase